MKKSLGFVFLGMLVGYSLACFLFREEYFVDVSSGKVREISILPPFKFAKDRSDRAFPLIFPSSQKTPEKWVKIGSSKKLPIVFFGKNKYTKGDSILAQQRTLISLFLTDDIRGSDRKIISDTYFEKISDGDFAGASEYVSKLWESSASRHSHESGTFK